jgi:hypothetical protein
MIPPSAVVVWQLRGFVEDVQCYFVRTGRSHTLAVERAGEDLLCEEFDRLADLMTRAGELRRSLLKVGFRPAPLTEELPEQPVLESLLLHFVREGTALLHGLPHA